MTFLGLGACEHSQDQISAQVGGWSRITSFLSAIRKDMLRHMQTKNSAISVFELIAIPKYYFSDDYNSGKNTA